MSVRLLVLACGCGLAAQVAGQAVMAQSAGATQLRTVQVVRSDRVTIVTLQSDGPLPAPTTGEAADPPRFFLDFRDVVPTTRGAMPAGDPLIQRVRVALNSIEPPVTRVVLDLRLDQPVRVDTDALGAGRVRVIVGERKSQPHATPPVVPVPPLPVPAGVEPPGRPPVQTTPGASTATPPTARPPEDVLPGATPPPPRLPPPGVNPLPIPSPSATSGNHAQRGPEKYKGQVEAPLNRLRALRPILAAIDLMRAESPPGLSGTIEELESIRQILVSVQPPEAQSSTHDMLVRSCALAQMAAKLRLAGSDDASLRNAGSAAAGALLLLDRVCIELGCGAPATPPRG
jgi:hypothetical protein